MNSKSNLNKLGVKKSHRVSLKKNLLSDLVIYEHMQTTKARAKAIAPMFDKAVKTAKMDLPKRELERKLTMYVGNKLAVEKLIEVFAKRFEKETTGLVKLYALQARKGDGAEQVKMIVKGYTYKEVGKKIATSDKKKEEKVEADKPTNKFEEKDVKANSQVMGKVNTSTVKSRSGI